MSKDTPQFTFQLPPELVLEESVGGTVHVEKPEKNSSTSVELSQNGHTNNYPNRLSTGFYYDPDLADKDPVHLNFGEEKQDEIDIAYDFGEIPEQDEPIFVYSEATLTDKTKTSSSADTEESIKQQLFIDRVALAKAYVSRRNGNYGSNVRRKKAQEYKELLSSYEQSLEKRLALLPEDAQKNRLEQELVMLSDTEAAFRERNKEKIDKLTREANHAIYQQEIAQHIDRKNSVGVENKQKFARLRDWVSNFDDSKLVDVWSKMSSKQRLAASVGGTALAAGTVAVLPFGLAAGATGAVAGGIYRTAKSTIRNSVKYKLDAKNRHKQRSDIIGKVTTVGANQPGNVHEVNDILEILQETLEADIKDNKKTIRRLGAAALTGAVTGGLIGAHAGDIIRWVSDKSGDIVENVSDKAGKLVGGVTGWMSDRAESVTKYVPEFTTKPDIAISDETSEVGGGVPSTIENIEGISETVDSEATVPDNVIESDEDALSAETESQDVPVEAAEEPTVDATAPEEDIATENPVTPEETLQDEITETVEIPDEVVLEVGSGDGLQSLLKDSYGLDDSQSWEAYLAIRPHLSEQSGLYSMGDGNFGISSPGQLQLNPQASAALRQYIESLEAIDTDDDL